MLGARRRGTEISGVEAADVRRERRAGRWVACFERFETEHCQPGSDERMCQWSSRYLAAHRAARRFNACLCASGTTCASCLDECTSAETGDVLPVCAESARAYCALNGK